ncbi:hypothetical protein EUZ85_13435 [Hahella sp. KA22]|uniref:hypothetical protein n=1 Tax=Hahella sp. KA22 TaxID=1628392 RepID=UPI000FDE8765|nr:hypothetical protein [Hahella sp. KA22]AZZ91678.1 hypothetical protein ENC22_10875 [Hahella sp. KA22]QAY55048.1 hypothetical protein EUZ85_13435 [Hahella sp. KA22]
MEKSTSLWNLNADHGLGFFDKLKWMLLNAANNTVGGGPVDKGIHVSNFAIDNIREIETAEGVSPARRLCDLFWHSIPLKRCTDFLEHPINAVEIGCGSGIYGEILKILIKDEFYYKGVDVSDNPIWFEYREKYGFNFVQASSNNVSGYLDDENFIFTQSALEHFDEDLTFFRQLADYVSSRKSNTYQVHLIPSESCIRTFPWHGVRQYSIQSISKITNLFDDNASKTLYRLGSDRCNKLHFDWITLPRILRKRDPRKENPEVYEHALEEAIRRDMASPGGTTCFYALEIMTKGNHCEKDS